MRPDLGMSTPTTLFSFWRSSCAWRVRIALACKKIPFELATVDLGAPRSPTFLALNPSGKVPVLIIDGVTLSQSVAILEYLEATRPEPRLIPADAAKAAVVRQIVQIIVSDTHPLQSSRVLSEIKRLGGDDAAFAATALRNAFEAIESLLVTHGGSFAVGDELSLADVCLVPQVNNAARFNVDLGAFPRINKLFGQLMQRPEFESTAPHHQADFPKPK